MECDWISSVFAYMIWTGNKYMMSHIGCRTTGITKTPNEIANHYHIDFAIFQKRRGDHVYLQPRFLMQQNVL